MLLQQDIDYCASQRQGVASITGEDVTALFNKLTTLFAMYNRLYDRLPDALKTLGQPLPAKNDDNARATSHVEQYLGGGNILANWSAKQLDEEIAFFSFILEFGVFHLKFQDGRPVPVRDAELALQIKSPDAGTKAKAILYVIYYVRCNIVHGRKEQGEDQRVLVLAAFKLLEAVTDQLYDKLAGVTAPVA